MTDEELEIVMNLYKKCEIELKIQLSRKAEEGLDAPDLYRPYDIAKSQFMSVLRGFVK